MNFVPIKRRESRVKTRCRVALCAFVAGVALTVAGSPGPSEPESEPPSISRENRLAEEHTEANDREVIEQTKQQEQEAEVQRKLNRDETIDKYFDGDDAEIMKAICRTENGAEDETHIQSTMNKDGTWDIGWCQINVDWNAEKIPGATRDEKVSALQNGDINIQVARAIFDSWGGTFNAWVDYKNGAYLKNMGKL